MSLQQVRHFGVPLQARQGECYFVSGRDLFLFPSFSIVLYLAYRLMPTKRSENQGAGIRHDNRGKSIDYVITDCARVAYNGGEANAR